VSPDAGNFADFTFDSGFPTDFTFDAGTADPPAFPTTAAARTPPPIRGGTLEVTKNGSLAIVSDPDGPAIVGVDLTRSAVAWQIPLDASEEPGRIAEDGDGRAHVVLRRGAIASIDLSTGLLIQKRDVCVAPRGIAYDPGGDRLYVACAEGTVVSIAPAGGPVVSTIAVAPDLRDIAIVDNGIFVSTFRGSEMMQVSTNGGVSLHMAPSTSFVESAAVAWRMIKTGPHQLSMIHHLDSDSPIPPRQASRPYYTDAGSPCGGSIVQSGLTVSDTQASDPGFLSTMHVSGAVLPVDVAYSDTLDTYAIAAPGNAYQPALQSLVVVPGGSQATCMDAMPVQLSGAGPVVAVAFDADGHLYAQLRDPAAIVVLNDTNGFQETARIPLTNEARGDMGHAIFHTGTGSELACASCHPEGGDDGRTWTFAEVGKRRTPSLLGTIQGTAPYHWDGKLQDMDALVHEVYEGRMGGAELAADQRSALEQWVSALPAPPAIPPADPDAAQRGSDLFHGRAGCEACHSGPRFTNNQTLDVGTGGAFQVPPLVGVRWRTPILHDGCARTLEDRFYSPCASSAHGNVGPLSDAEILDLVHYLETL
jgi:hypothetical protein